MSIKSRKLFAIIVMTAMILTLLPMTAFAATDNSIDRVPSVAPDHTFTAGTAPILRIAEKNEGDMTTTQTFRLSLTNAEWAADPTRLKTEAEQLPKVNAQNILIKELSKTLLEVSFNPKANEKTVFRLPLITKMKGAGEATVSVESWDSVISSGTYPFANATSGATIASISKVETFARSTKAFGTILIDEANAGTLSAENNKEIRIKLDPKFKWIITDDAKVSFSGRLSPNSALVGNIAGDGERELIVKYNAVPAGDKRGSIIIEGLQIRAERDAPYGDVYADISGTEITNQELLVAKYISYSAEASVEEVKDVVAGRHNNKTAKITIEENLAGALIAGRELSVVLPDWVKVTKLTNKGSSNVDFNPTKESSKNAFYFEVKKTNVNTKSKYVFELELSVEADKTGEIVAEFFGAGMEKQEVVIANAVAPVTVEINPTDLRIGLQNQEAPDIIITENARDRIDGDGDLFPDAEGNKEYLTIGLPVGFEFTSPPTVEVIDGNLELAPLAFSPSTISLRVKSNSTKPSTIKISNIKLTVNRSVPEGDFDVQVGGGAIVKNHNKDATSSTEGLFNKGWVVKTLLGTVITPAPGEIHATTTFTIGSTTYTVVEAAVAVEKTMDVAPYIKDGRTYLPVRFVADALGVTEDNIIWDPVNATVTIFKGDRIAQMTIGSKILLVNGVQLTMDAAPEIVSGRTMLPVRWMAQALGATIEWDAETQQVTVTQ